MLKVLTVFIIIYVGDGGNETLQILRSVKNCLITYNKIIIEKTLYSEGQSIIMVIDTQR